MLLQDTGFASSPEVHESFHVQLVRSAGRIQRGALYKIDIALSCVVGAAKVVHLLEEQEKGLVSIWRRPDGQIRAQSDLCLGGGRGDRGARKQEVGRLQDHPSALALGARLGRGWGAGTGVHVRWGTGALGRWGDEELGRWGGQAGGRFRCDCAQ